MDIQTLVAHVREPAAGVFLVLGAVWDLRSGRIPNALVATFTALALGLNIAADGTAGCLSTLKGFGLGLALLLVPFAAGGIGAGDVKFLATAGAFLGPARLWHGFVLGVLLGGAWALAAMWWHGDLRGAVRRWSLAVATFATTLSLRPVPALLGTTTGRSLPYAVPLAVGLLGVLLMGRTV